MGRLLPNLFAVILMPVLAPLSGARAQDRAAEPACEPGQVCVQATHWGAWGLIALGLVFLAVWLMPSRRRSEEEESALGRMPMLRALQSRIDKEMTGWHRYQWLVLGLFFVALGVATLFGWR